MELPSLNRRRLLLGLAAASTAAAVPIAVNAAVAPSPENADLLALADQLDATVAETAAARAHKQTVIDDWWWEWPSAPASICDGHTTSYNHSEGERGLTGVLILASGKHLPERPKGLEGPDWRLYVDACRANPDAHYARCVGTSKLFADRQDDCLKSLRRKRPKHPLTAGETAELQARASDYAAKALIAAEYEAECERVRKASGYAEAVTRDKAAFAALAALVGAIINTPAETMVGVMVKAQALAAWEAEPMNILHFESWKWSGAFAADVIRIASLSA